MSDYRRLFKKGGFYFFTAVTYNRKHIFLNELSRLRASFRYVLKKHPFKIKGIVILPDHLHTIWELPQNDHNFSIRWNLLKKYFSSGLVTETNDRREKTIWQRRFWEHLIRDEEDFVRCLNYIHYNPVKHGYVSSPQDWHASTFLRYVQQGYYDLHWGANGPPSSLQVLDFE